MIDNSDYIQHSTKMVLYTYSTKHLSNKDKVRFYYALKGRDGKSGFIKRSRSIFLAKTIFLVPYRNDDDALDFFRIWNIPYSRRRVLIDNEEISGGMLN